MGPKKYKTKRTSKISKSELRRLRDKFSDPTSYGDSLEVTLKRLEELLKQKKQRRNTFNEASNTQSDFGDIDMGSYHDVDMGDNLTLPRKPRQYRRRNSSWEDHKDVIKEWFCKTASYGTPDPTLKKPYELDEVVCSCSKQVATVHVFMTHNVHEMQIKYCKCRSLVETMIIMQVFPSSAKRPDSGCHFALLDLLHLFKMNAHVSNHAFADIVNQHLLTLNNDNTEIKKLSEITLNSCYQNYRKVKD